MKIEVWSDYVCPFCYIGKRRLEQAIEQSGLEGKVEVEYKAYMLDPSTPVASGRSMLEGTAQKFKVSTAEAESMMKGIAEQAETVGLHYKLHDMKVSNTKDAHRLAKLAKEYGKEQQVTERLMHGYFTEGEQIDVEEVLVAIANEAGLDTERTKTMLAGDEFADAVQADIEEARQVGVQGVPFFVLNRKYALSGAQATETFAEALKTVAEEEGITPGFQMLGGKGGGQCDDDGACDV